MIIYNPGNNVIFLSDPSKLYNFYILIIINKNFCITCQCLIMVQGQGRTYNNRETRHVLNTLTSLPPPSAFLGEKNK